MENKIKLELIGITYNQIEYGVYALVLQQVGGKRRIPIIIGHLEAQAIECKLQEIVPPRPLTHDTMLIALAAFGISLKEVVIKKLPDGVFGADIHLVDHDKELVIDSRASDAISLAIRVGAPIYTTEDVLLESGFDPDEKSRPVNPTRKRMTIERKIQKSKDLSSLSETQLSEAMLKAAEAEDYEEAARIKAELDNRKIKD